MVEEGTIRYLRCKLAVDKVLTGIVRDYMTKSNVPFKTIYDKVISNAKFKQKLNQKDMTKIQFLPEKGFANFDINLMYKIARYPWFSIIITDEPTHGWDRYPQPSDETIGDNIERIRKCRNEIAHNPHCSLTNDEYDKAFQEYQDIGRRADAHLDKKDLHYENQVDYYKTCQLDKKMEEECESGRLTRKFSYNYAIKSLKISSHLHC